MRTMLLSFSPKWYDDLSSGKKIFEHRKRFYNDSACAYIYLGLPYRQILAKTILWPKQNISDWSIEYSDYYEAVKRIQDYLTQSKVAMPIYSFQAIEPIDAIIIEKEIPSFRVPISYMFLDDKPELLNYITEREKYIGKEITHTFESISSKDICIC